MQIISKLQYIQVWIIIINNAIDELVKIDKFSNRKLFINIEDKEDHIIVEFIDNAGGIKDEVIDNLFEPFKRTKSSSGMGLGLSIAKKIIDEQNGTIRAYNKNNGAVFEIKLPKKYN